MIFIQALHTSHIISLIPHSWIIAADNYISVSLYYTNYHRGETNCSLVV